MDNIISQITNLLKNAGLAPELMQKAMGLLDGIDMNDIAGILPEIQKLGLPPQIMDQIQNFISQQVMNNIPGGDMIGSMMGGNMGNIGDMGSKIGDSIQSNMPKMSMPDMSDMNMGNLGDMVGKATESMSNVDMSNPTKMATDATSQMTQKSGGFLSMLAGLFGK